MTFTRKVASTDAQNKSKKLRVVSVRLTEEEYQQVVENYRKAGRKLSRLWRRALLNAKIIALATPEDMAILRQIGSMSKQPESACHCCQHNQRLQARKLGSTSPQQGIETLTTTRQMIGSITKGSDFGGCVRYALAVDEPGKVARLLCRRRFERYSAGYYQRF